MTRQAGFLNELTTTLVDEEKNLHRLKTSFMYECALLGRIIVVPAGFLTDFASIPRIVGAYLLFGNLGTRAAVIHDWAYSHGIAVERETADAVFLEALEASGYSRFTRYCMWAGVRLFGQRSFDAPNLPQPRYVIAAMEQP